MRWLVFALAVVACPYDDPDYGGTSFKCDATHGCPAGQSCIDGACTGSGSSSSPDGIKCKMAGVCPIGM